MLKYKVSKSKIKHPEIGECYTYGIIAYAVVNECEIFIDALSDVSVNMERVQEIVNRCNSNSISPFHLLDFVEECIL